MSCEHKNTIMWEPHLAGARKCKDCGMVYNPNYNPKWYVEIETVTIPKDLLKELTCFIEDLVFTPLVELRSKRDVLLEKLDKLNE